MPSGWSIFAKMKVILNSFSMFWKMPKNLALHTSISYLLTTSKCTFWKSFIACRTTLQQHSNYSKNITLHDLLSVALHSNSMSGNEWNVPFGHNTSHFARWNRDVYNAPISLNHLNNLPSLLWSQHKCN
jgi:hypothetical protein